MNRQNQKSKIKNKKYNLKLENHNLLNQNDF